MIETLTHHSGSTAEIRGWMRHHADTYIFRNPAIAHAAPHIFAGGLRECVETVIRAGGFPLRALLLGCAIHFTEIWEAPGVQTFPADIRPGLRCILETFLLGRPGGETPERFIMSIGSLIYDLGYVTRAAPLPAELSRPAPTPRAPEPAPEPADEHELKMRHHMQLKLKTISSSDFQERMAVIQEALADHEKCEFMSLFGCIVARCLCYVRIEAARLTKSPSGDAALISE